MSAITERWGSGTAAESGAYRYRLTRRRHGDMLYPAGWRVAFVMLNPSTANATEDDPTIRRCFEFAEGCRADRLDVVNLFAYRATKPAVLVGVHDTLRVGSANDQYITEVAMRAGAVVLAWGAGVDRIPGGQERAAEVIDLVRRHAQRPPLCLGYTSGGHPRHPLFVKGVTVPEPFERRSAA